MDWIRCLYPTALTLSDRFGLFLGHNKLGGSTSDAHITWALDVVGVPAGLRNIDVGTVVMGPANAKGRKALDWIREVAATEGGELYVDHRDGGKIRFTNRYRRFLATRSKTTVQATFSDDPAAGSVIRYPPEGLDIVPNDIQKVINQVTADLAGGSVTVEDAASILAYRPRSRNIETVATTPGQPPLRGGMADRPLQEPAGIHHRAHGRRQDHGPARGARPQLEDR